LAHIRAYEYLAIAGKMLVVYTLDSLSMPNIFISEMLKNLLKVEISLESL